MRERANTNPDLANQWEAGSNLVKYGDALVKNGEKQQENVGRMVSDANALMKEGNDNINAGYEKIAGEKRLVERSEEAYHDDFVDKPAK